MVANLLKIGVILRSVVGVWSRGLSPPILESRFWARVEVFRLTETPTLGEYSLIVHEA